MTLLRIAVGFVAVLISLAGIFWYGLSVFGGSDRGNRRAATTPVPTGVRSAPLAPTPFEERQRRRSILLGVAAVIGGLLVSLEAVQSIRTGIPIHTLDGHMELNGWVALTA